MNIKLCTIMVIEKLFNPDIVLLETGKRYIILMKYIVRIMFYFNIGRYVHFLCDPIVYSNILFSFS